MPSYDDDELLILNGSWEQKGRSPNTAALAALFLIGALYFNAQSILVAVAVIIKSLSTPLPAAQGNLLDQMADHVKFSAGPLRIVLVISEFFFMLFPGLWLIRRWHTSLVREYIRLKKGSAIEVFLAILATLVMIPAVDSIANYLTHLMHVPERLKEINAAVFTAKTPWEFFWLVFVVCVTPAICEETFFRGYIQRTFERTIGWKSIVLIGILFGLFHFQPLGLITLSLLGVLFGYFFFRSGSLLPSMAAHFTNNFIAIAILYRQSETSESPLTAYEHMPFWLVAALFLFGIGILSIFHRITIKRGAHIHIA